jgi:hypothetical protein
VSVHASRLRSRQSAGPPVTLAGPNGVLRVARRMLREEAFLRVTPHLRGPVTSRILTTFAGQGAVNGWVSRLPAVPRAIDRLRYAPIPVWSAPVEAGSPSAGLR